VTDIDVAIVGGGLGGLSAAAHLARAGRRVAVFDKNDHVGGFATSYRRGEFRFEASLHLLDACRPGEPNHAVLVSAGIADRLELAMHPVLHREIWPSRGLDLAIPQGEEGLIQALSELRPAAGPALRRLLSIAGWAHESAYRYLEQGMAISQVEQVGLRQLMSRTAEDLLREHVEDAYLQDLLGTLACYQIIPARDLAALQYLLLLCGYHRYSGVYPLGGSRSIAEALAAVVREHGGSVQCRAEVTQLMAGRDGVLGCRLADGTEVRSGHVVSAVAPPITFGRLLDPSQVPRRWKQRLDAMALSPSLVRLSLGLDLDPRSRGLDDYEIFVGEALEVDGDLNTVVVTLPARLDPRVAPRGKGVLSMTVRAPAAWGTRVTPESRDDLATRLLEVADRHVLPGLREHVEVRDLAHPGTYARYSGAPRGAVLGYASTPRHSGTRQLGASTPLRNLFLAGGWVFPGSGQSAALWSGRIAAQHVLGATT